jgi:hypothetical protein
MFEATGLFGPRGLPKSGRFISAAYRMPFLKVLANSKTLICIAVVCLITQRLPLILLCLPFVHTALRRFGWADSLWVVDEETVSRVGFWNSWTVDVRDLSNATLERDGLVLVMNNDDYFVPHLPAGPGQSPLEAMLPALRASSPIIRERTTYSFPLTLSQARPRDPVKRVVYGVLSIVIGVIVVVELILYSMSILTISCAIAATLGLVILNVIAGFKTHSIHFGRDEIVAESEFSTHRYDPAKIRFIEAASEDLLLGFDNRCLRLRWCPGKTPLFLVRECLEREYAAHIAKNKPAFLGS